MSNEAGFFFVIIREHIKEVHDLHSTFEIKYNLIMIQHTAQNLY